MKHPNNSVGVEVCKLDGSKRDFCYSLLSVIIFPFVLFYSSPNVNSLNTLIEHILEHNEIPLQIILFLVGMEVFKLFLTFTFFPSSHLLDPMASVTASKLYSSKLPVSSRRDRDVSGSKSGGVYLKIVEFWKVTWNFILCCGLCHLLMVLMGAPVFDNFLITAQFSVILASWTFFPLCLALRPSFILIELVYLSIWNTQIDSVSRAKWRFILTLMGAMAGAAFIPLDWDRPWQKWPITCFLSSAVAYLVVNTLYTAYLLCTLYCRNIKVPFLNRNSKVKYF